LNSWGTISFRNITLLDGVVNNVAHYWLLSVSGLYGVCLVSN
jgi:hypothetical protein